MMALRAGVPRRRYGGRWDRHHHREGRARVANWYITGTSLQVLPSRDFADLPWKYQCNPHRWIPTVQ